LIFRAFGRYLPLGVRFCHTCPWLSQECYRAVTQGG